MQKVVGSSPIIRFTRKPRSSGAFGVSEAPQALAMGGAGTGCGYRFSLLRAVSPQRACTLDDHPEPGHDLAGQVPAHDLSDARC